MRNAQYGGSAISNLEVPLRTAPNGDSAIRLPPSGRSVWLDIALMNGLRAEDLLHDDVGLGEALLDIA